MSFDIAVVGLANRFPGATDPADFWSLLIHGRTAFTTLTPAEINEAGTPDSHVDADNFVPVACRLESTKDFDADFFGVPAREALLLDPQHRLFLECVWEAFEDAGLDPARQKSAGVFAGASLNTYLVHNLACNPHLLTTPEGFLSLISNEKDYLATRVSYKFDLHGPAVTVQTACSTSLVAVHTAMQNLVLRECDVAVAGGVSVKVPQDAGYLHQPGMPFSEDGTCRCFDATGSGTVFGSGAGVVILKRLADAEADGDDIYCVIRASAMNNDGSRKVGFTAPSTEGQAEVIQRALAIAGVAPASVDYVEAHATATPLGDPIETAALGDIYGRGRTAPLRIGSVKSNFGHMETAAGIAGLIKTVLMLKHKKLVPSAGFETPNPHIDFEVGRLSVQTKTESWTCERSPSRCRKLVRHGRDECALGPRRDRRLSSTRNRLVRTDKQLFVLSAKSDAALAELGNALAAVTAETSTSSALLAANLQTRRAALSHRHAFLAGDLSEVAERARRRDLTHSFFGTRHEDSPRISFGYCGGGAQYLAMCAGLMREPVFAETVRNSALTPSRP